MSYKEIAKEILEIEISALQKLIEQDLTDFDNIIELMLNCKGKIIVSGMGNLDILGKKFLQHLLVQAHHRILFIQPKHHTVIWV